MVMIKVILILILFLQPKIQHYVSLSSLYHQKTTKNYQNFLVKDLKDKCLGMNIKQRVRTKIPQTSNGKVYNTIINGKNVYDQPIDSDIKRYDEIRKLTAGQDEDYTTGYLLHHECIKNH